MYWQGIALLTVMSATLSGYGVYKVMDWRCDAARVEAVEQMQAHVDELNERYRQKEKKILNRSRERQEALNEFALDLSRDISECRINDGGLQDIQSTVERIFPSP